MNAAMRNLHFCVDWMEVCYANIYIVLYDE